MNDLPNIVVALQVVSQIVGFGEQIIGLEISVVMDGALEIKVGSDVIVQVNLSVSTQNSPIQIVQIISESDIARGTDKTSKIFKLQDILWVKGMPGELEVIESSALIYYIGNN